MKPYIPNKLIFAVQKAEKEHPLVGTVSAGLSADTIKRLVLLINSKSFDELEAFSKVLTRRESNSLCLYLLNNTYDVDLKKIIQVIKYCMNSVNYRSLFSVWQQVPMLDDMLGVLGEFDEPTYREDDFPVRHGLLRRWSGAVKPISAIVQTSTDIGAGKTFIERFMSLGFKRDSKLTQICNQEFFTKASVEQFYDEGDSRLSIILGQSEKVIQEKILLHLLSFGTNAERRLLPSFKDTYQKAYDLWKEPGSKFFPDGYPNELKTYTWWYNYRKLEYAFGKDSDPRRLNFWKQYLHMCSCLNVPRHSMLVMEFGRYVVTEFWVIGAIYIFDTRYYHDIVQQHMQRCNTSELKSWLYNVSDYKYRKAHFQNWEIMISRKLSELRII